jgi:GAF domain-containing protein
MSTNLISQIHNCVREEDILQKSVECVKQALKCDRVVVYSVQEQNFGKILAEAVERGFPRTLETTIDDPCFKSRHVESYRQGAITRIDNIHEARMTPCYIENLDRLAVKANLVVPMHLPNNELYALLIVHQCSAPRAWTDVEITLAAQMSAQIGWAVDNALRWTEYQHAQVSLDRHQHYQDLLTTTYPKIYSGNTRIEVLQIATAQVREVLECDRAIVYVPIEQDAGIIVAESSLPALASIQDSKLELPYFEHRYIEEYQQGRVRAIDNIHEAGFSPQAIENLAKIAVKANVIVPIINNKQELVALLVAHQCFNCRQWQDVEVEWLRQIGIQTGLALAKAQLQEEIIVMKSSLKRARRVKDAISSADTKIQQIKQSLADSVQTSGEVNHLMRLLDREVTSLKTKVSDEDLNLARIITKKLQANAETANAVNTSLQDKIEELSTTIDSGNQVYKSRKLLEGVNN